MLQTMDMKMNQKEACQGMMKMLIGDNEKKLRSKPPSK
jgi:hypothetical protein